VISYEVSYRVIILILVSRFSRVKIKYFARFRRVLRGPVRVISIWFVIILAESNRSPFDIAEGESELVSGFNVEYAATGFVLIFLSEYLSILVLSCTTVHCFLGIKVNSFLGIVFRVLVIRLFIVVRGSFPRLRYDIVIKFA
jgi:NADH-ubiquinone oxidoreductase chain 1